MTPRKRILFVDDEPRVRDAIQRLVRPFASEWQVSFAPDAAAALERLVSGAVDVLVTDIAMPGGSGADLLREAAARFPEVVRIVLAPAADQPLVMGCASLTHQFITRPCDADVLHEAIGRACDLEASVRRERVARIVARMDRMPSLPDVYLRLVERIEDPECSIEEVGDIVSRDIGMTARILKLVNSAFFGLRRRVSNPREAVNYVGIDTVRALVLSISAFAQYERCELGGVSLDGLWNHSLRTAGIAKAIAVGEGAGARTVDDAFVSGMLHDVGKLVLGSNFGNAYGEVVAGVSEGPAELLAAEQAVFGANHAEIGGHLLGLWGLPGSVVDAITWHHHPLGCPEAAFGPLACVHAADVWAHEHESAPAPALSVEYFDGIGMSHRIGAWRHLAATLDDSRASA